MDTTTGSIAHAIQVEESAELPLPALAIPETPSNAPTGRVTRLVALVRNRLSYALGDQVVYSFGNMVVAALLSRHAGPRTFGMYILTQRTLDILIQLCNTLSWAPFTFNLPSTAAHRMARYRGSVLLQQVIASMLCLPLMALAARWASTPGRGVYYGTFHPLIVTGGIILFREFNRRMYFADMRMREAFWTEVATVALQIAGVEFCFRTGHLDVPHTLWALANGAGIVGLWWLARELRSVSLSLRDLVRDTALNFRLGRWLLGSNFVFVASNQANPWILSAVFGGSSVGAYAVCESIVNIPRVALVSLQNVFAPVLARAYAEGGKPMLRQRVSRIDRMLTLGSVVAAIGITAFGPFAARVIFGKSIPAEARTILFFLGLNFVAFAATMAQGYALSAIDRAGSTLLANLVGLVAQAAAAFLLVSRFGVPGAAAALCLGSVVVLFVRQVFYNREISPALGAAS
ncbi:lipopolysaccharide biosynthesis protein [Terriglobus aquaticus]|uniref:Lipopolysaccharide biosynthesis protein n=1 Tax=Terriglobus aquaticus TaxID=940139 RepID=A0ABW9KFV7_9BACT|nr:lipopolysaccharide biosynthesis protein [Terriglobus aquaticus]